MPFCLFWDACRLRHLPGCLHLLLPALPAACLPPALPAVLGLGPACLRVLRSACHGFTGHCHILDYHHHLGHLGLVRAGSLGLPGGEFSCWRYLGSCYLGSGREAMGACLPGGVSTAVPGIHGSWACCLPAPAGCTVSAVLWSAFVFLQIRWNTCLPGYLGPAGISCCLRLFQLNHRLPGWRIPFWVTEGVLQVPAVSGRPAACRLDHLQVP